MPLFAHVLKLDGVSLFACTFFVIKECHQHYVLLRGYVVWWIVLLWTRSKGAGSLSKCFLLQRLGSRRGDGIGLLLLLGRLCARLVGVAHVLQYSKDRVPSMERKNMRVHLTKCDQGAGVVHRQGQQVLYNHHLYCVNYTPI